MACSFPFASPPKLFLVGRWGGVRFEELYIVSSSDTYEDEGISGAFPAPIIQIKQESTCWRDMQ